MRDWILTGLTALSAVMLLGADDQPKLLATASVRAQITEITSRLAQPSLADSDRSADFERLKVMVSEFVVAQLEAEPSLAESQLRDQLLRILGDWHSDSGKPWVQKSGGSDGSVWGLAYASFLYQGSGGSRTVVEAYVVEHGKARLAGRGGGELDGVMFAAEPIVNPTPNSMATLIHGIFEWSSGHALPAKAVLYGINATGVKVLWQTPTLPGLQAFGHPNREGFTIMYHDEQRHRDELADDSVIEVYVMRGPEPKRIVQQHY